MTQLHGFEYLLLFIVGLLVGVIGTAIGAGGGFILVPILLFLYPNMLPQSASSISLFVIFFNACSGSVAYAKMRRIDYKSAFLFALATLPGSIAGAYLTEFVTRNTFNRLLGILLIAVAIYVFFRPKSVRQYQESFQKGRTRRVLTDKDSITYAYSFRLGTGIAVSFAVGFISSLLGIGGGIIHVPVLTSLLHFPVHIATATSHLVLTIMALAGTLVHLFRGHLQHNWIYILCLAPGVICGAQVGAAWSNRLKPEWIIRLLSASLFLVGLRLLITPLI